MNELTVYMQLLKGANIGNLSFANNIATAYSKLIERSEVPPQGMAKIYAEIIGFYGSILEEDEEEYFKKVLQNNESQLIIDFLRLLDVRYADYFLEMISERRETVEIVYEDVSKRVKIAMSDEEIVAIKKAESLLDIVLASNLWKKITVNERNAIIELKKATKDNLIKYLLQKFGSREDTEDVWIEAQVAFRKNLTKLPHEKGFYQWRPIDSPDAPAASIKTYFLTICRNKWVDSLRKVKALGNISELPNELSDMKYENPQYEREYLSRKMKFAISKLPEKCQKIIVPKWLGGKNGEVLSSKELSVVTGYAIGTIDSNHKKCLQQLGTIWKNINLKD
jgi:RNA polymerase sigma factor (sigma-70 family)